MTYGAGLFLIWAHLVTGGNTRPTTLDLKNYKLICEDVLYYYDMENYNYVGFYIKSNKNYLTTYTNIDTLKKDIDNQCKK